MNHSGRTSLIFVCMALLPMWIVAGVFVREGRAQNASAMADQFAAPAPVMTFLDMNTGQPWGRYIVSETVTVPKYEYKEVKEQVWVPVWVQEPRTTTTTDYVPVVSYQIRPRSVPSMNPFSPPQQIMEYAPIVQYQPRNVQAVQMTTYQKYEPREISRMIPQMVDASEQRAKFVDRPLTAPPSAGPMASNLIQESAMVAQATRTTAHYPTRSIDYPMNPTPYGNPTYAYASPAVAWSAPRTMIPPPANAISAAATTAQPVSYSMPTTPNMNNAMAVNASMQPPASITVGNGVTYSAALVPVPSAMVATSTAPVPIGTTYGSPMATVAQPNGGVVPIGGFPAGTGTPGMAGAPAAYAVGPGGYPYPANAYGVPPGTPYPPNAASPYSWFTGNTTLFSTNLFNSRPSGTAAAASVPPNMALQSNAPNFWGRTSQASMPTTFGSYPPAVNSASTGAYPYQNPMQPAAPPTVMR